MFSLPPLSSPFYSRVAHNRFLFSASSPTVLSSSVLVSVTMCTRSLFRQFRHRGFLILPTAAFFFPPVSPPFSRHPCYFLPQCAPSSHFPSHPFSAFPSPRISPKPVNCILSHRAAPRRDREGLFMSDVVVVPHLVVFVALVRSVLVCVQVVDKKG